MTVEAMTTNHPTCCADCSHYRGDQSYDCSRCPGNASSARPVWCPLEETVSSEVWGGDVTALLSYDARRWLAENAEIVESLASGAWKAVPVDPTLKMVAKGEASHASSGGAVAIYDAMLAAAPANPESENDR